jgi:hypothetical protein
MMPCPVRSRNDIDQRTFSQSIGKSFDPMCFDRSGNGETVVPQPIVSMTFPVGHSSGELYPFRPV